MRHIPKNFSPGSVNVSVQGTDASVLTSVHISAQWTQQGE